MIHSNELARSDKNDALRQRQSLRQSNCTKSIAQKESINYYDHFQIVSPLRTIKRLESPCSGVHSRGRTP